MHEEERQDYGNERNRELITMRFWYMTRKGNDRFWSAYCSVPKVSDVVIHGFSAYQVIAVSANPSYKGEDSKGDKYNVELEFTGHLHSIHSMWTR